jgi:hypothetical protein
MKYALIAAALVLITPLNAQTAKVIPLEAGDARHAKDLDDEIKALTEEKEKFTKHLVEKYLVTAKREDGSNEYYTGNGGLFTISGTTGCFLTINGGSCPEPTPTEKAKAEKERQDYEAKRRWVRAGWGSGSLEYSDDYKFIVPAKIEPPTPYRGWNNGCLIAN